MEEIFLKMFSPSEIRVIEMAGGDRLGDKVWQVAKALDHYLLATSCEIRQWEEALGRNDRTEEIFQDPTEGGGGITSQEQEKIRLLLNRAENFSAKLLAAKVRFLENPLKYGFCQKCGGEIPLERLKEVPHAPHCVVCKNDKKNNHNHGGK